MTVVAIGSVKGSPGASTTAVGLAAAWPCPVVLVEADPDGGTVAARMRLGFEPGLVSLATACRTGVTAQLITAHSQDLVDKARVVVGPDSAVEARSATELLAPSLVSALRSVETVDALVDVGRVSAVSPAAPIARAADVVVLVVRPVLWQLQHLPARVGELTAQGCQVGLVCVGERDHPPAEAAALAGVELVGSVADDATGADSLGVGGLPEWLLRRTRWWRSVKTLAVAVGRTATHADGVLA